MNKLNIALEHCYGIRKFDAVLDYTESSTVAIYAPNGAMKSSLATTFQDIADGALSKDRIFPTRVTRRDVKDERSGDLSAASVLVLKTYEEVATREARQPRCL